MEDNWVFELHICQMKKKQALRTTSIYILEYICILYFYIFLIIRYVFFISHGQNWVFVNCMAQMIKQSMSKKNIKIHFLNKLYYYKGNRKIQRNKINNRNRNW